MSLVEAWNAWKAWRRERKLRRVPLDPELWRAVVARYPYTRVLTPEQLDRLQTLVRLFLHDKQIHGAGGFSVTDDMRLAIAVQACILILELDADCYRGWVEIIVYPDEFVARYEYVDEDGVVHDVAEPMTGEAWAGGPVILSWADAEAAGGAGAYNVVIHEFAHKLDMLNGESDGFPPLHAGMCRERWSGTLNAAYADFCARLERGEEPPIDDYAAESPGEFFAVLSEVFFEQPGLLEAEYRAVYAQFAEYYRQDPARRSVEAGGEPVAAPGRLELTP